MEAGIATAEYFLERIVQHGCSHVEHRRPVPAHDRNGKVRYLDEFDPSPHRNGSECAAGSLGKLGPRPRLYLLARVLAEPAAAEEYRPTNAVYLPSPFVRTCADRQKCIWCRRQQGRCTFSEIIAAHRFTKQHRLPTFHIINGMLHASIRVASQQKRRQFGPPAVCLF